MRRLIGVIAVLFLAAPAQANGIEPLLQNGELQRSSRDGRDTRHDLWRFSPDGSFTGTYQIFRPTFGSFYTVEGNVTGTWKYANNQLCIEANGLENPELFEALDRTEVSRICYDLRKAKTTSYSEYVATNASTGANWQMFIYPRRRY